jgi:Flp pilus assembly protein TadD
VTLFDRVLARAPNDAHALSGKGVGLDLQDLSAEALHWHAAAAKVASDDLMVMNNFAVSLLLAGKPNEAVPILTRLVDRPGAPSRVLNNLTLAAAAAGPAIPSGSVAPIRGDDRDVLLYALMLQAHPTPPASEIGR